MSPRGLIRGFRVEVDQVNICFIDAMTLSIKPPS